MQRSVFVAPDMEKKDWQKLQHGLRQLFARRPLSPADSVYLLPLRNESVGEIGVFGVNNVLAVLSEKKLKMML